MRGTRSAGEHITQYLTPGNVRYGASFFRRPRTYRYVRRTPSLFHYPKWSGKRRWTLDWLAGTPQSGLEPLDAFGPHTLEVRGVPFQVSNQTIEERLRRFFIQFGTIRACQSVPHPQDPFQSSGTAYVSFEDSVGLARACRARLRFMTEGRGSTASLTNLETGQRHGPSWYNAEQKNWNHAVNTARCVHTLLQKHPEGLEVDQLSLWLMEDTGQRSSLQNTERSVYNTFGSWLAFLDAPPFRPLFRIEPIGAPLATLLKGITSGRRRSAILQKLYTAFQVVRSGSASDCWNLENCLEPALHGTATSSPPPALLPNPSVNATQTSAAYQAWNETMDIFSSTGIPTPAPVPGGVELAPRSPAEKEKDQIKLRMALNHHPPPLETTVRIRDPSSLDTKLLHILTTRKWKVFGKLLSPSLLEYTLECALSRLKRNAELERTPNWLHALPAMPPAALQDINLRDHIPPLPESLQLQSRAGHFYQNRIYDERHMFALELRAAKRALREKERRLWRAKQQVKLREAQSRKLEKEKRNVHRHIMGGETTAIARKRDLSSKKLKNRKFSLSFLSSYD